MMEWLKCSKPSGRHARWEGGKVGMWEAAAQLCGQIFKLSPPSSRGLTDDAADRAKPLDQEAVNDWETDGRRSRGREAGSG